MESVLAQFHFLRPLWLLGIIPAVVLFVATWFMRIESSRWNREIDRSLLPYLLDKQVGRRQGWPLIFLLCAWILVCLSLAGPVWKKLPQPVQTKEDALVLIQDLSLSFYANDLSPNRLTRAQHKLQDILALRGEGTTALIVYSGDAHIVAPLTDDSRTIDAMVSALSPGIMPAYGSNLIKAVTLALQLLKDAGAGYGRILLLTDEVEPESAGEVSRLLKGKNVTLSILGVGTQDGGPIPRNDGGFLKDNNGTIVIPRLNSSELRQLAEENGGRYRQVKLDDSDITDLLAPDPLAIRGNEFKEVEREFDQWEEMGPWLLLPIILLALFAFRRGWIVSSVVLVLLTGQDANAMEWQDLWLRKDQQGAKAMAGEDFKKAGDLFTSPSWKGSAAYRAGDFAESADLFSREDSRESNYNRGNALAREGKLEDAVKAYDKALQLDPDYEDAAFNKDLVEKLIQQQNQEKDEQESEDNKQQQDQQEEGEDKQEQGQDKEQEQDKGDDQGDSEEEQQKDQSEQSGSDAAGDEDQEQSSTDPQPEEKNGEQPDEEESGKDVQEQNVNGNTDESEEEQPRETAGVSDETLSDEEQQALEQWLRQVPDDPGGYLRRKFEYEFRKNRGRRQADQKDKIW